MRKVGVMLLFLLVVSISGALAEVNSTDIDKAYECLENKINGCSSISTQDTALSILATPDAGFDECVTRLEGLQSAGYWGNIKDTSLAILALDHAGKNTDDEIEWLKSQSKNSTDLTWYVQVDSDEETTCRIIYDNQTYNDIDINEDKTLSAGAGSCLTRANNNYFFSLSPTCLEKQINIECENDFIVALAYKYGQSATLNLLDKTQSAAAFGSISFEVLSKCFGASSVCDFESSVWASYALLESGEDIEDYMPYLIATSEGNSKFMSEAFLYLMTSYDSYSAELISDQTASGYWEAPNTPYSRFYDTALAILALGASNQNVVKTLDWLYFSTDSEGCWQGSIRDTAMILWATEQRAGRTGAGAAQVYCEEVDNEDYFCVPSGSCSGESLDNFYCANSKSCCTEDVELSSCAELNGSICGSTQTCSGNTAFSSDSDSGSCCLAECRDPVEQNACEAAGDVCRSSCNSNEEESTLSCDTSSEVCCDFVGSTPGDEPEPTSSNWWIWVLIVLILIVLGLLAWVYRDKIKSAFNKDNSGQNKPSSGMPPRGPGIPPRMGGPGYSSQLQRPPSRQPIRPQGLPPKPGFPPVVRS